MSDWKIIEQLKELHERQIEICNILVEIGGALPAPGKSKAAEDPVTDIGKVMFVIGRITETTQENLELARQIHGRF